MYSRKALYVFTSCFSLAAHNTVRLSRLGREYPLESWTRNLSVTPHKLVTNHPICVFRGGAGASMDLHLKATAPFRGIDLGGGGEMVKERAWEGNGGPL